MVTYSLFILGDILTGSEHRTEEVVKLGAVDNFFWLLGEKSNSILKEACWSLGSITLNGKEEYVSLIVKNPIYMEKLISLINFTFSHKVCFPFLFHLFFIFFSGYKQSIKGHLQLYKLENH